MEIVCELADTALVSEYGIPLDNMSDENRSFYEEYQDRFNDLYDEIEERLLTINRQGHGLQKFIGIRKDRAGTAIPPI